MLEEITDIDLADPALMAEAGLPTASEQSGGFRDFSAAAIQRRHDAGYKLARLKLHQTVRGRAAAAPLTGAAMSIKMQRAVYADMFGPTTGDRVRLADTDLIIEVEKDFTTYGEEVKFGGGKVIRDGMGQSAGDQPAGRGRHRHHQRA